MRALACTVRDPTGAPSTKSLRVFARGSRLFEVSAIGPALSDAAIAPFEDGLHFDLVQADAGH